VQGDLAAAAHVLGANGAPITTLADGPEQSILPPDELTRVDIRGTRARTHARGTVGKVGPQAPLRSSLAALFLAALTCQVISLAAVNDCTTSP